MSRWDDDRWDDERRFGDVGRHDDPWNWPHAGAGVASFIIVLSGIVVCTLMIVIGAIIASNSRGRWGPGPAEIILIIGGMILALILDLTALGLGIAGLCQSRRKKVFAILGTVFSALILIVGLGLFLMALVFG